MLDEGSKVAAQKARRRPARRSDRTGQQRQAQVDVGHVSAVLISRAGDLRTVTTV